MRPSTSISAYCYSLLYRSDIYFTKNNQVSEPNIIMTLNNKIRSQFE